MNILEYENYQEKKDHGDPLFPYTTYICTIPLDFFQVPLHWHEEMELIYIKKGQGLITVDFEERVVKTGTLILIIPGQLHSINQLGDEKMEYENILFQLDMLHSSKSDFCFREFFTPLLKGDIQLPTFFTPEHPCHDTLTGCVDAIDGICASFPSGYQFFIKGQLFLVFYTLFSQCLLKNKARKNQKSMDKIKFIIKYTENHYTEKISIQDISDALGLSQSHFMKFFKNTMGSSYIDYLNDYRLTMASRLLLSSESTILTIAGEVGFDNLSYFNRVFKKKFGTTPSNYRNGAAT